MRNLLALFGALVLVFVGVGWYLRWYDFRAKDGRGTIDVNTAKVTDDVEKGATAVSDKIKKSRDANIDKPEEKAQ